MGDFSHFLAATFFFGLAAFFAAGFLAGDFFLGAAFAFLGVAAFFAAVFFFGEAFLAAGFLAAAGFFLGDLAFFGLAAAFFALAAFSATLKEPLAPAPLPTCLRTPLALPFLSAILTRELTGFWSLPTL